MTYEPGIKFENVTIEYNIYNTRSANIRNKIIESVTGGLIKREVTRSVVTALKQASFSLKVGDRVGLIGGNGAGKTTLLRAMAGIYLPLKGKIQITGSVTTIIDIGAGMEEELSGIQNVYRLCLLRGLSTRAIKEILSDVEEFSGLGEYLKLPVRTYSSGMKIRLMFAVATIAKHDILLIDETFSMGDNEFQKKATLRMQTNIAKSKIFVFASHDLKLIRRYCNRVFKMEHGILTEISVEEIGL